MSETFSEFLKSEFLIFAKVRSPKLGNEKTRNNISKISESLRLLSFRASPILLGKIHLLQKNYFYAPCCQKLLSFLFFVWS